MNIVIIALGWLGESLYDDLESKNINVSGSYFSNKKNKLNEFHFNYNSHEFPKQMSEANVIIFNLTPSTIKNTDTFKKFLNNLKSSQKLIFISSTSVYGQDGNVDEYTEPIPQSDNGKLLKHCEELVLDREKSVVIRPAGLYGNNRHPGKYLSGKSDIKGANSSINLIDIDSLKAIIIDAIKSEENRVINAVNIQHPQKKSFYTKYCEKNNLKKPEFSNIKTRNKTVSTRIEKYKVSTPLI